MATFVLVHGSGDGSWIWKRLTPLLRTGKHEVYTPTLTGVGDRSHLVDCGVDLNTHIKDVTNLIEYEDLTDVILVGHSYAGMVITGVAAKVPERLSQVVYLDAYLPEAGQSEADLWPADMKAAILGENSTGSGVRKPTPAAIFGITDPELAKWVEDRTTSHPMACYFQPAPPGDDRSASLRYVFIHCTEGITAPIFATFANKAKARGWEVYELISGHLVMLTLTAELAALLLALAGADDRG